MKERHPLKGMRTRARSSPAGHSRAALASAKYLCYVMLEPVRQSLGPRCSVQRARPLVLVLLVPLLVALLLVAAPRHAAPVVPLILLVLQL